MRHKFLAVGTVLTALAMTIGLLTSDALAQGKKVVMKFSSHYQVGTPAEKGVAKWAELVKERSKGRIEIQHFPASQLGKYNDMLEQTRMGTVQGAVNTAGGAGQFVPAMTVLNGPYLFRDMDHYKKVVYGPIGKELNETLAKKAGLRVLNMNWYWGYRHFTTKKPVYRPEDLKGLKIRVSNSPIYNHIIRALGATPTPMDISEVYTALQTGVVDGQENPPDNIKTYNFHEVQKYIILDGHILDYQFHFISEKFWKSLTEADRKLISTAALEAETWQNGQLLDRENKSLVWLQEKGGMTAIVPDRSAFQEAAAKAFPGAFKKDWGDYWEKIQALQ